MSDTEQERIATADELAQIEVEQAAEDGARMENLQAYYAKSTRAPRADLNDVERCHKQSQLVNMVRAESCKSARALLLALSTGQKDKVEFALTELGGLLRCEELETEEFHNLIRARSQLLENERKEGKSE